MMVSVNKIRDRLEYYPRRLLDTLLETAESQAAVLYISGGALRDWLLGISPNDLDFTISYGAAEFLEQVMFRVTLAGATFLAPSNPFGDYVVLPCGLEAPRTRHGGAAEGAASVAIGSEMHGVVLPHRNAEGVGVVAGVIEHREL